MYNVKGLNKLVRGVIEDKKRGVQYSGQERDSIEGTGGLS